MIVIHVDQEKITQLSTFDHLTGLPKRSVLHKYIDQMFAAGEQERAAFFFLDLDHFKPVNDTYGHDMGDKLLKEAANRLQSCIRSNDYAFRIGGDEFSLVVCTEFDESLCCRIKEQIQNQLCAPFDIDGKTLYIGSSCCLLFMFENPIAGRKLCILIPPCKINVI